MILMFVFVNHIIDFVHDVLFGERETFESHFEMAGANWKYFRVDIMLIKYMKLHLLTGPTQEVVLTDSYLSMAQQSRGQFFSRVDIDTLG